MIDSAFSISAMFGQLTVIADSSCGKVFGFRCIMLKLCFFEHFTLFFVWQIVLVYKACMMVCTINHVIFTPAICKCSSSVLAFSYFLGEYGGSHWNT